MKRWLVLVLLLLNISVCSATVIRQNYVIELTTTSSQTILPFGLSSIPDYFIGTFTISYEVGVSQSEQLVAFNLSIGDTIWLLSDLNQLGLDYNQNIDGALPQLSLVDNLGTSPLSRNLVILDIPNRHEWSAYDARVGVELSGITRIYAVSEPGSLILLSLGLLGLALRLKRN